MTTRRLANGERFSMMTRLAVESELVQPARQLVGGYMSEVGERIGPLSWWGTPSQHDAKDAPVALVALDFDAAAVGFDGPGDNGQAEPGAARLSRANIVHAIETLEDPLAMRSGNAGSRVAHVDRDAAGLGPGRTLPRPRMRGGRRSARPRGLHAGPSPPSFRPRRPARASCAARYGRVDGCASDMNVRNSSVGAGREHGDDHADATHIVDEEVRMRRHTAIVIIGFMVLAAGRSPVQAESGSIDARRELARALVGAWLP